MLSSQNSAPQLTAELVNVQDSLPGRLLTSELTSSPSLHTAAAVCFAGRAETETPRDLNQHCQFSIFSLHMLSNRL